MLTRYGLREWLTITIIAAALAAVAIWLQWWWALAIVIIVWLALLSFFRDPPRTLPANLQAGDMISPADGVVSAVLRVDHHESTAGPAILVRIFLSVLNVHVNRSPFDAEVVALRHTPGTYHDARTEESALHNESNLITLRIDSAGRSETIGVRQVAGKVARRIVCPLTIGDRLQRGERFGMIKFGSTTELILPRPHEVTVHVAKGDQVRGGLTILATLRPPTGN
jgi:phosphatidylserine decarboxylase